MKFRHTLSLLLLIFAQSLVAQEQLGKAQQAERYFERYEFSKALPIYIDIFERRSDLKTAEKIGECYRMMSKFREAEEWYARAATSQRAAPGTIYEYAGLLLNNQKFEAATAQYKRYFSRTGNTAGQARALAAIDSAALWTKNPAIWKVENLKALNSSFSDWGLAYYQSGFVFNSDRPATPDDRYLWTGDGWTKLYMIDNQHDKIQEFPFGDEFHSGPVAFNPSQDTAYITLNTGLPKKRIGSDRITVSGQQLYSRRLELAVLVRRGAKWELARRFPYNNVNRYSIGHAAVSKDGKFLYFASDMPGGEGKTDIWYCRRQADGSWGTPRNCGKAINTAEEEAFPTIGAQGRLYFASTGLPGMGGFDLFSAAGSGSSWEKPLNLRFPLNSTRDDFWLLTTDGLSGYFSSNREGGLGSDDIYSFSSQAAETSPAPTAAVIRSPDPVAPVPPLSVFPGGAPTPGKTFVLKNIYYDLDQSAIRPDAAAELDLLVALLKENPGLKIELSSHTDSRAPDDYNMALSQRRAEAAVSYLVDKGISRDRLLAKGYGEARLFNNCSNGVECTLEQHQLNRRTEFKIADNQ